MADTFNVVYDASDRISSITHEPPGIGKFAYEYNGTSSISFNIYDGIGNTNLTIHESYYLNSNQKVDSIFQYNDTQDTFSAKFIYNQANFLIEARYYQNNSGGLAVLRTIENYTYDAIGNRLTTLVKNASNNLLSTTNYTYNNILNNIWLVPVNLPLPNKNLPLTEVEINALNVETSRLTYEYTFDSQSRVLAIKLSRSGIIVWKYFSYQ